MSGRGCISDCNSDGIDDGNDNTYDHYRDDDDSGGSDYHPDTHRPPDLIIIFSRFWAARVMEGGDGRGGRGLLRDEEHLLQP